MKKKYYKTSLQPFLRSGFDRRSPDDRRQIHDLDYFDCGGKDRRQDLERRSTGELREDWVRYTQWSSVYVGD